MMRITSKYPQFLREFITEHQPLDEEQERELYERIQGGDDAAVNELAEHNFRFAWEVSRDEDEFQEAVLGLMEAARSFDPEQGRYITYAAWKIRNRLTEWRRKRWYVAIPKYIYVLRGQQRAAQVRGEELEIKSRRQRRYVRAADAVIKGSQQCAPELNDPPRQDEDLVSIADQEESALILSMLSEPEADVVTSMCGYHKDRENADQIARRRGTTRYKIQLISKQAKRRIMERIAG